MCFKFTHCRGRGCELCTNVAPICMHNLCEGVHDALLNALACDSNARICEYNTCEIRTHIIRERTHYANVRIASMQMVPESELIHGLLRLRSAQNGDRLHVFTDIWFVAVMDIISKPKQRLFPNTNARMTSMRMLALHGTMPRLNVTVASHSFYIQCFPNVRFAKSYSYLHMINY